MEKLKVSLGQMNLILVGIEHGFKQGEKGKNLEAALLTAYDMFEVVKPKSELPELSSVCGIAAGPSQANN